MDLEKLGKKVDEALDNETKESITKWLRSSQNAESVKHVCEFGMDPENCARQNDTCFKCTTPVEKIVENPDQFKYPQYIPYYPIPLEFKFPGEFQLLNSTIEDYLSNMVANIEAKKLEIISRRLKEIVGIDFFPDLEARLRFKRLAHEFNGNEETIYFNDGSPEGRRIVTFVRKTSSFVNIGEGKFAMNEEYSYY